MQVETINNINTINELQFGNGINHAVHEGRRADFALILSMFSDDVRDNTPVEQIDTVEITDQTLRQRFELQPPQALRSDQSSYDISARQAEMFHAAGLSSAKLSHYLNPEVLTYLPEQTHDLPEEVYHNLSLHQQRQLGSKEPKKLMPFDLYNQLIEAQRTFQIQAQA
ncbi:VC2046/SO_2500 family protein [Vibrio intestinalis]|uniref:VC2046/SO_2500 family protein n=1 Tax=Vibrio intestinalis TaxID=2933291 RepID=UPI0021A697C9|nr:VC2046/SO_2500 family protein [Vibrio intestinalis]